MTHHVIKSNVLSLALSFLLLQCSMLLFFAVFIGGKVPACEHYVGSHPAYAGWQRTVGQRPTIPVRWSLSSSLFSYASCYALHYSYAMLYHLCFLYFLCFSPYAPHALAMIVIFFWFFGGIRGWCKAWKRLQILWGDHYEKRVKKKKR